MDFHTARIAMVEGQLMPNGINDNSVIKRYSELNREKFTPVNCSEHAYADTNLKLSESRCMLSPLTSARMIQNLNLSKDDNVLVIASGCGFETAIIASICSEVTAVESCENLSDRAKKAWLDERLDNINLIKKNVSDLIGEGLYDAILVNGALAEVSLALKNMLTEQGRLVTLVQSENNSKAIKIQRFGHTFVEEVMFETAKLACLPGSEIKEKFEF